MLLQVYLHAAIAAQAGAVRHRGRRRRARAEDAAPQPARLRRRRGDRPGAGSTRPGRRSRPPRRSATGVLDGIPLALPALTRRPRCSTGSNASGAPLPAGHRPRRPRRPAAGAGGRGQEAASVDPEQALRDAVRRVSRVTSWRRALLGGSAARGRGLVRRVRRSARTTRWRRPTRTVTASPSPEAAPAPTTVAGRHGARLAPPTWCGRQGSTLHVGSRRRRPVAGRASTQFVVGARRPSTCSAVASSGSPTCNGSGDRADRRHRRRAERRRRAAARHGQGDRAQPRCTPTTPHG